MVRVAEHHLRAGEVTRDVDEHRAGATGRGDVERLAERLRKVVGALQEEAVLHHGHGDAHDVGFLEGVGADDAARDLARDDHERHGVHVRRGDARHRVGGAGAGRHEHDAHLAGGAGVAIGLVHRTLLVAGKDVTDLRGVVERVVDLDGLATGVPEERVHALGLEARDDGLGSAVQIELPALLHILDSGVGHGAVIDSADDAFLGQGLLQRGRKAQGADGTVGDQQDGAHPTPFE